MQFDENEARYSAIGEADGFLNSTAALRSALKVRSVLHQPRLQHPRRLARLSAYRECNATTHDQVFLERLRPNLTDELSLVFRYIFTTTTTTQDQTPHRRASFKRKHYRVFVRQVASPLYLGNSPGKSLKRLKVGF